MRRVKFKAGEQRAFLKRVILESGAPSLRSLNQFGFSVPYSTLKNYFNESRKLPEDFFIDLCYLSKINKNTLNVEYLEDNFGQVLGGRKSKR